jgi:DNA-binding response OmpR family regulator
MPRILVVEDDPDLLFLYHTALSQIGIEVINAENATLAMAELDQGIFDLMMLDLNMPDAHGTEVIKHLRRDPRHNPMPIIIVTANDHWLDESIEKQAAQVLVKPVSMREIVELVRRYLAL